MHENEIIKIKNEIFNFEYFGSNSKLTPVPKKISVPFCTVLYDGPPAYFASPVRIFWLFIHSAHRAGQVEQGWVVGRSPKPWPPVE